MQLAARPESESVASKPLSTLWLYQPAPFGLEVGPESLITGFVLSIMKAELVFAEAVLAATSLQELESTVTAEPSPEVGLVGGRGRPASGKWLMQLAAR